MRVGLYWVKISVGEVDEEESWGKEEDEEDWATGREIHRGRTVAVMGGSRPTAAGFIYTFSDDHNFCQQKKI